MMNLGKLLTRYRDDESGNVFMMLGLYMFILLGLIGICITLGTSTILHTRLQNAGDAAALAGAIPQGVTNAERHDIAQRYFALNFPDGYLNTDMTAARASILVTGDASNPTVTVNTEHERNTDLVRELDLVKDGGPKGTLNTTTVGSHSVVGNLNSASLIDMVMVMDASSSMTEADVGGTRIDGAFNAAEAVIDGVLRDPSVQGSRLGWSQYALWCDWPDAKNPPPTPYDCSRSGYDPHKSRMISRPLTSNAATIDQVARFYQTNVKTPPIPAHPTWDFYGTNGADGLETAETILGGSTPGHTRAVIYMTDGINNMYHGQWFGDNAEGAQRPTRDACTKLKTVDKAVIYTVAFGPEACVPANTPILQSCASSPDLFFCARSNDELRQVFKQIITSVKNIRISE